MNVAVLGGGAMGQGLATRLLAVGHEVRIWNRTPDRVQHLAERGVRCCAAATDAVDGADVVVLSLSDETATDDVLAQVVPVLPPGTLVIDTTTTSPAYARSAARRLAGHGLRRVEACLLGNPGQAAGGQLRVLAAGRPDDVAAAHPLLGELGHDVQVLGTAGCAATAKLVFNSLLGTQIAGLAEAVHYGERAGLDPDALLDAISGSGFSSLVMSFRAQLMRRRAYEPASFRASLMAKDLHLVLTDGERQCVDLPVARSAAQQFDALVAAGGARLDAAAVLELRRGSLARSHVPG